LRAESPVLLERLRGWGAAEGLEGQGGGYTRVKV
jgi:hypothetical protein